MFDRQITDRFLRALERIEHGSLRLKTPDGKVHTFSGSKPGAQANMDLNDWRTIGALMRHGDIGLAQTYRDGWWDSLDCAELFLFGMENQACLDTYIQGNLLGRIASRLSYFFTRNTVHGSKKNIHAHYDLGNDFYALWLDATMTYSSGLFSHGARNLHDAQIQKYDRILERLNTSGSLLEIGCGWGGFAERALHTGDYGFKGLTISNAQHAFASNRVGHNAAIALEDYRHQKGRYDQIVSIEMFEAVGEKFWPVYFSKLKSLLADKGKAVIQTITISDSDFHRYRTSGDAIRTFIFPGGMLPSPEIFKRESLKAGLRVNDEFAFGQDYALTLSHWLENFEAKIEDVRAMGFDDKFVRMWRFYLTWCIAAFKHGRTDVVQWELQHAA